MIITFNGSHNDDTGEEKKYNNHYREDNFDNVYNANEKKNTNHNDDTANDKDINHCCVTMETKRVIVT